MANTGSIKTFKNLIEEIHNKNICQLCGGCVSFCSAADYKVINFINSDTPPVFVNENNCLECGICYYICPQTHVLLKELDIKYNYNTPIGQYKDIYSCQATDAELLKNGTDGGVVSAILLYLLENNLIDGAIVSKKITPFSRDSMIAKNKDDLISAAGSFFDVSSHIAEISNHTTYSPTITELRYNRFKFKKLAIVGTPCQIYTVRCMQEMGVTPSQNIQYVFGLFCYSNFKFNLKNKEKFENQFKFKIENVEKLNVKENMIIILKGNEIEIHIPFENLTEYMRPACFVCNDFTNLYADIAFGGLSSPNKYTTVLIRTNLGKKLFKDAKNKGYFKILDISKERQEEMIGILADMSTQKNKRSNSFCKVE